MAWRQAGLLLRRSAFYPSNVLSAKQHKKLATREANGRLLVSVQPPPPHCQKQQGERAAGCAVGLC
jgi:hypothetical protein